MKMTPQGPNDYVILILSHGRPEFLKSHTWKLLDDLNSHARKVVVLSDDDKKIPEYRKTFDEDSIVIFSKIEAEKVYDIDLIDCYWGPNPIRKAPLWGRIVAFDIAKKLGYRWFLVLDDDYVDVVMRKKMYKKATDEPFFPRIRKELFAAADIHGSAFDECCLKYFNVLESAPWLCTTAFSQIGDFIGGVGSVLARHGYRWKAMNAFFCDNEKVYRFFGRINEDVNAYVLNGKIGRMALTMANPSLDQTPTQQASGGMKDFYDQVGTYVKSVTSAVACPSSVAVSCMGFTTPRVHHSVNWALTCPVVVNDSYCKDQPLDFDSECGIEPFFLLPPERKSTFMDADCETIENADFNSTSIDNFF